MLYVAVATRAFRRYSTYVAATLAGIFTNCVFGIIILLRLPRPVDASPTPAATTPRRGHLRLARPGAAMTVALWGGGTTDDLAERIRTGDVAIDLYRPVGLVRWYLASDLGRAAYHLLTRGLAPTVVGVAALRHRAARVAGPRSASWSRPAGGHVSFAIRFLVARSAPSGCSTTPACSAVRGLRAVLQRDGAAARDLPRRLGDRAWRCPGRRTPGPGGHLARQARGLDCSPALGVPGDVGRRAAGSPARRVLRPPPARWWSRVADTPRRCARRRPTPRIARLWIRSSWPTARRS